MIKKFTLQELTAVGHEIEAPFMVGINPEMDLQIDSVLRLLPGKRIVGIGEHKGKRTLIKIFFYSRNYLQEINGFERIKNIDIKTSLMMERMALEEGGICFYELLENTASFDEAWKQADQDKKQEMMKELLDLLKKMFAAKLCQSDLHLGNFLYSKEQLYALDPASCAPLSQPSQIAENLAVLLAQFPLADWDMALSQITECFPAFGSEALRKSAKIKWHERQNNFLRKIYRECTYIHRSNKELKGGQTLSMYCVREKHTKQMQEVLENIQTIPDTAEILKRGESSVVSLLPIDGTKAVIKNSRNKNIWRLLRRCFRRSRASNAWHYSHLLMEAGVNTPKPIALVEKKWGPLVLESWFVSEHIEGDNLLDVWLYQAPSAAELDQIKNIFSTLKSLNLVHGDMKASNLLLADEKIYLIDYDGMGKGTQFNIKKDAERFLQNWPNQPWLSQVSALISPEQQR